MSRPERELKILLIDDEEVVHQSIGSFLERMGYQVLHAMDGRKGMEWMAGEQVDIVVSDIKMPGMDGIDLLREINRRALDVEVILITGHGDLKLAIEALRQGAFDFFTKPIRLEELIASLERTRRYQEVRREKDRIQRRLEELLRSGGEVEDGAIIGESRAIREVMDLIDRVACSERTTVLITGESGTGKELVARAIHRKSPRSRAPFVTLNCTAIPENLLESELFGHERGAFTDARNARRGLFELAHGGTLFLDEIGDMSLAAQAKILRVLEDRRVRRVGGSREIEIDTRLIAATHQDLRGLMKEGRFREDLYFRLNVFTIHLPPLRERGDDVLLLAYHFLKECTAECRKEIVRIDPEVQDLLRSYSFPGNVRELRNLIERAVILCDGSSLTVREFSGLASRRDAEEESFSSKEEETLDLSVLEARAIRSALRRTGNNQTQAARLLGIGHDALRYRLKKYGIA